MHLPFRDHDRERVQCNVLATPRPKPVREAEKVRLVDLIEHVHERALDHLVLERGHAEWPLSPVRLGYQHSAHGLGSVRSAFQA